MAEGFEPGDQATGFPFRVLAAGEVVGAEFVVGLPVARTCQMVDQKRVGDHGDGFPGEEGKSSDSASDLGAGERIRTADLPLTRSASG